MGQFVSVDEPVYSKGLGPFVVNTASLADAMGLLPAIDECGELDLEQLLSYIHRAGIGQGIQFDTSDPVGMLASLTRLNAALQESPAPEFEWVRMEKFLGMELLSKLVGTSTVSIRRYLAKTRTTPDDIAARLHVLSLIVGDLNGAYNEAGIRQWFQRRRTQLEGKSPMELLVGAWRPDDDVVAKLRALSGALAASPAT